MPKAHIAKAISLKAHRMKKVKKEKQKANKRSHKLPTHREYEEMFEDYNFTIPGIDTEDDDFTISVIDTEDDETYYSVYSDPDSYTRGMKVPKYFSSIDDDDESSFYCPTCCGSDYEE